MEAVMIRKNLFQLIEDKLKLIYEIDFVDQTNFFIEGIVDSIEYLELITAIEENFNIKFTAEEIASQALDTPESIYHLVNQKTLRNKVL